MYTDGTYSYMLVFSARHDWCIYKLAREGPKERNEKECLTLFRHKTRFYAEEELERLAVAGGWQKTA